MRHQSMTDRRCMEKARRFTRDNIALAILTPPSPTPPQQFKAKMRPLRRLVKFPRSGNVFVDVQLRTPPMVQRSPLVQTPEPPAKIVRPLILPTPGLIFRRFSAKRRQMLSFDYHTTKGYLNG